jgi:DNA-binding response OmpR family regulator
VCKTILIAANDPNIIYLLRRYAEASGFKVARCDFGEALVDQAKNIQPVLILLEIEPPESSWRPYVQQLKADHLTQSIPIVLYSYLDEMVSCQEENIAGFLQKSVMYTDFIVALGKAGVQPIE